MLNMEILAQASYGEVINNIGEQSREKTCMGQLRGSHQVQVLAFSKETKKKSEEEQWLSACYQWDFLEDRDTTLNGAFEATYNEMASRHRYNTLTYIYIILIIMFDVWLYLLRYFYL